MNRDEIKTDIETEKLYLEDCETTVKVVREHLAALEAQFAEAEKREWQQGDYGLAIQKRGTDSGVYSFIFVGDRVYYNSGTYDEKTVLSDGSFYEYVRLGNIFTDLKALSEPLKEYRTPHGTGESLRAAQEEDGGIVITTFGKSFQGSPAHLTVKKTKDLILNLRRLICTAEQEAAK